MLNYLTPVKFLDQKLIKTLYLTTIISSSSGSSSCRLFCIISSLTSKFRSLTTHNSTGLDKLPRKLVYFLLLLLLLLLTNLYNSPIVTLGPLSIAAENGNSLPHIQSFRLFLYLTIDIKKRKTSLIVLPTLFHTNTDRRTGNHLARISKEESNLNPSQPIHDSLVRSVC